MSFLKDEFNATQLIKIIIIVVALTLAGLTLIRIISLLEIIISKL